MKLLVTAVALVACSAFASAQIDIIGWNMPTAGGIPIGFDSTIEPYIDGVTIPVDWSNTDTTTCGVSSCSQSASFQTFYNSIKPYISGTYGTCGKSLPGRGAGHPCIINIVAHAVSNPTTNSDTPSWVFGPPWTTTYGSQDVAFCGSGTTGYSGGSYMGVGPPTNAYANITSTSCPGGATPPPPGQCTVGTLATGIPAVWESAFMTAVQGWWSELITWASGNSEWITAPAPLSQIRYIRFGFSIGGEATTTCAQELESALGGGDAALKAKWLSSYAMAASDIGTQRSAQFQASPQFPGPTWAPMMSVNMGQGLTTYPGGTDPSWATGEAQTILANQPFAIGTQGLENGTVGTGGPLLSDLFNIKNWNNCTGANCCSDNWCNVRQIVIGQVPYIEMQTCNISTAGGGTNKCLDAVAAGTATTQGPTLSQVFILSSEQGTTSAEIYYQDLQCATVSTSCITAGYQPAYKAAILSLAAGSPASASAMVGTAQTTGTVQIF